MIKSNVSAQQGLVLNTSFTYAWMKRFPARAPWTAPACRYAALLNNLAAECILVEDTAKFIPVIALQYHWHYGRDGFATVNPRTPYKEKENRYWNQARGHLPASGGPATPSSRWFCRVPNSDNQVFFSFPSSLALVRDFPCPLSSGVSADSLLDVYLHRPQVMEGHLGHSWCTPEQALTICLWRLVHRKSLWRAQLKKALSQKESLHSFQQALNQTLRKGKKHPHPPYEPCALTVACVHRCSPAISVHKQQHCLKSVTLIYIGDRIPVLFTTEFLFPETITLLVEKVDLSTSCLKLFVYQKWVLHNLCQCLNKEQSWS